MRKKKLLLVCIFSILILQGCNSVATVTRGVAEFNAAVKANPDILNNQDISRVRLNSTNLHSDDGVILENMTIRNLTFRDVQMRRAKFRNVTFIDCTFIKVDLDDSKFSNVKFIRGVFKGQEYKDYFEDYQTTFQRISIDRVLFDGIYFDKNVRIRLHDGIVVLKNITTTEKTEESTLFLGGSNLQVRIDNCKVYNQAALVVLGDNSSAYVTNSSFINANLDLTGRAAWIENCILSKSATPEVSTLVIKNSRLLGKIGVQDHDNGSKVFLTENTYSAPADSISMWLFIASDKVRSNSHLYLYADTNITGKLVAGSGNINIYGADIDWLEMGQQLSKTTMPNMNLEKVKIKAGNWEDADIQQGKWQNVQIYPSVNLKNSKFGKIIGHKVEFPQGTPWVNGTLEITNSYEPLKFDKPPVPTLEELGLAQFWKENDFPVETY